MTKAIGVCYVGKHISKKTFIILRFTEDTSRPGIFVQVGIGTTVSEEEMNENGGFFILRMLGDQPPFAPLNEQIVNREMLRVKREHALVSVSLNEISGRQEIEIVPLHGKRGWKFESYGDEIRKIQLPFTNTEFVKCLREALEIAT